MARNPKREVVAWAASQIGQQEEPPGSNRGSFVEFCQSHTWLKPGPWPWCVAFVLAAIEEGAGVKYPDPTAGAWDMLNRAKKRGWARTSHRLVEAGDVVIFNIGSGHAAILEKIVGQYVHTIDGNAADMVKRCVRPLSTVRGFVCWPETELPARRRSTRFAQVVGGESGNRKLVIAGKSIPLPAKGDKIT